MYVQYMWTGLYRLGLQKANIRTEIITFEIENT